MNPNGTIRRMDSPNSLQKHIRIPMNDSPPIQPFHFHFSLQFQCRLAYFEEYEVVLKQQNG